MDNEKLVFTLDDFDDAVAEECASIETNEKYKDKQFGSMMLIMTGMAFSAAVRRRLINKTNKED